MDKKYLQTIFAYDPETGELRWRERADRDGAWNSRCAGKVAGTICPVGYRTVTVNGKAYRAHRIIYMMMTGAWPDQVDHINQDKSDNRWENLRSVSALENRRNGRRQRHNTSGIMGVVWLKDSGTWKAEIKIKGKFRYLGAFKTKLDAAAARKSAELAFGFHPNHGS